MLVEFGGFGDDGRWLGGAGVHILEEGSGRGGRSVQPLLLQLVVLRFGVAAGAIGALHYPPTPAAAGGRWRRRRSIHSTAENLGHATPDKQPGSFCFLAGLGLRILRCAGRCSTPSCARSPGCHCKETLQSNGDHWDGWDDGQVASAARVRARGSSCRERGVSRGSALFFLLLTPGLHPSVPAGPPVCLSYPSPLLPR